MLSLIGCNLPGLPGPTSIPSQPAVTQTSTTQAMVVPTTLISTPTSTVSSPKKLILWLPPQFDPSAGSPASNLLKKRLQDFSDTHSGIPIEVRIKAASGPGGLLDALATTSAAAPTALPDLIALSRNDLEAGAIKGLLFPFDNSSKTLSDKDWYSFAQQMSLVQGIMYGMPFAGDALVMVYRPSEVPVVPTNWTDLLHQNGALAFPAADPQSLMTLTLYVSGGGLVTDTQQRPALNVDTLVNVLKVFESGVTNGFFPAWLTTYDTDGQAWQAFKDKRATWVVTWVSQYLAELPTDTSIQPFLPLVNGSSGMTVASGWVWALGNSQPERQTLSNELAKWLADSSFLSQWTSTAGYLPPRPTSLANWSNQGLQTVISQVANSAQLLPSSQLLVSLGPVLRDATLLVLKLQNDPVQAAQAASERLKGP